MKKEIDWRAVVASFVIFSLVIAFTWYLVVVRIPYHNAEIRFIQKCIVENRTVPSVRDYCQTLLRIQQENE